MNRKLSSELVSVVIPTYNYGNLVSVAVDSVLAQTYPHVEIIVVDDGSTDDTRQRLQPYGDKIVYHYQENAGLSAARNKGISLARGRFIALLDSDDAFHPEKLRFQVAYLQTHPHVNLVGTDCFSDEPLRWPPLPESEPDEVSQDVTLDQLVIKSRFSPSSVLARRECFDSEGLFDIGLKSVEDRDLWIRLAAQSPIATIRLPLTWYRLTPGSMSKNAEKMERCERLVLERAFQMPQLKRRWLLRQKAIGLAFYSAAYMHLASGSPRVAWRRMLASFCHWPLPIHKPDV